MYQAYLCRHAPGEFRCIESIYALPKTVDSELRGYNLVSLARDLALPNLFLARALSLAVSV